MWKKRDRNPRKKRTRTRQNVSEKIKIGVLLSLKRSERKDKKKKGMLCAAVKMVKTKEMVVGRRNRIRRIVPIYAKGGVMQTCISF
jgi:hypothetical protein